MSELGLIHSANNGTYYLLPVLQRSIEKLTSIVDEEMSRIGGQKMTLPILTSADLWNQTGRLQDIGREVMTSVDRHSHTQILSPVNNNQSNGRSVRGLIITFPPFRPMKNPSQHLWRCYHRSHISNCHCVFIR